MYKYASPYTEYSNAYLTLSYYSSHYSISFTERTTNLMAPLHQHFTIYCHWIYFSLIMLVTLPPYFDLTFI